MKTILPLIFALLFVATACQNNTDTPFPAESESTVKQPVEEGMQRVVASTPDDITQLISDMGDGTLRTTRSSSNITFSENEEKFVSLIEANREEVMNQLTPAQKEEILNDDEDLEFCPSDSVIADIQFAQLLNAEREIQVGQTVYKYLPNGVASTDEVHAKELRTISDITSDIRVTDQNEGKSIRVSKNVNFVPIAYQQEVVELEDNASLRVADSSRTTRADSSTGGNMVLSNGVVIPANDIRDVNYSEKGDGNWLQKTWSKLWGKSVLAIKKFNSSRKLVLSFYDQNYIVYSKIGTTLKMQKKKCGFWWNMRCDEMEQGWDMVALKYDVPTPINPELKYPGMNNPTITTTLAAPYSKGNVVMFYIPFTDFDFTRKDFYNAYKTAAKKAYSLASAYEKKRIKESENIGLMCFKLKDVYLMYGPHYQRAEHKKSIDSKFHSQWFANNCQFQFSIGSKVNLKSVKISKNDGVELFRGRVYGAIKYKGKWLGARITKDK